jgi:uncharacterized membrane protein YdjX (TVP38/TMEM64 family)
LKEQQFCFSLIYTDTVKDFLPLALLLAKSFFPPLVFIFDLKPCFRALFLFEGWYVLFINKLIKFYKFCPFILAIIKIANRRFRNKVTIFMEKTKKIKLFIGLSYLLIVSLFLYFFFSKFSLQEITSYDFLRNNRSYLIELKNSNLFLVLISFLFLTVLWVFPFLGFGSPVALMGGFIFGKWIGAIIVAAGLTIGATFLYIFGNYFLKELIREKFLNKFQNLEKKFQKSEFIYLLIYRIIGGIPWQLQSLLPLLFNVKIKNYFFSTFFGIIPGVFLIASIGSGMEKIIDLNSKVPKISDIIFSPDIYLPLLAFFVLIISTILFRKRFYKD